MRLWRTSRLISSKALWTCLCLSAVAARGTDQERMEGHGEQQASEVLRFDRTGSKTAQQRNAGMGQAGGGDRQNPGGVVESDVCAAKDRERAASAVSKGTG